MFPGEYYIRVTLAESVFLLLGDQHVHYKIKSDWNACRSCFVATPYTLSTQNKQLGSSTEIFKFAKAFCNDVYLLM